MAQAVSLKLGLAQWCSSDRSPPPPKFLKRLSRELNEAVSHQGGGWELQHATLDRWVVGLGTSELMLKFSEKYPFVAPKLSVRKGTHQPWIPLPARILTGYSGPNTSPVELLDNVVPVITAGHHRVMLAGCFRCYPSDQIHLPEQELAEDERVTVKTLAGQELEVRYSPACRVDELKDRVAEQTGIPADQQRMICRGKKMEDRRTLIDYNIIPGSVIHLVLRLKDSSWSDLEDQQLAGAALWVPAVAELFDAAPAEGELCSFAELEEADNGDQEEMSKALNVEGRQAAEALKQAHETEVGIEGLCHAAALWTAKSGDSSDVVCLATSIGSIFQSALLTPQTCGTIVAMMAGVGDPGKSVEVGVTELGLLEMVQEMVRCCVAPFLHALFPSLPTIEAARTHGFVIRQCPGDPHFSDVHHLPDGSALPTSAHKDDSLITVNLCLAAGFAGGELGFPHSTEGLSSLQQVPGQAVIHLGAATHSVAPTTSGERFNLILWCRTGQLDAPAIASVLCNMGFSSDRVTAAVAVAEAQGGGDGLQLALEHLVSDSPAGSEQVVQQVVQQASAGDTFALQATSQWVYNLQRATATPKHLLGGSMLELLQQCDSLLNAAVIWRLSPRSRALLAQSTLSAAALLRTARAWTIVDWAASPRPVRLPTTSAPMWQHVCVFSARFWQGPVAELVAAISNCTNLRSLHLTGNYDITWVALEALGNKIGSQLHTLDLAWCCQLGGPSNGNAEWLNRVLEQFFSQLIVLDLTGIAANKAPELPCLEWLRWGAGKPIVLNRRATSALASRGQPVRLLRGYAESPDEMPGVTVEAAEELCPERMDSFHELLSIYNPLPDYHVECYLMQ